MTTNSNQLPTEYKLGLHCPMKKNQKVESLKKKEMIKLITIYNWDNFTWTKSNLHLRTSHERVRQKNDHLRFLSAMNLYWSFGHQTTTCIVYSVFQEERSKHPMKYNHFYSDNLIDKNGYSPHLSSIKCHSYSNGPKTTNILEYMCERSWKFTN